VSMVYCADIPVGISHQGYTMAGQGADYYAPGGERPFPPPLQPKVSQESYASYQETASMHTRGVTYEDQQPTKTYSKTYKSSDPRSTLVMVAAGDLNPSEAIWPLPESLTGKSLAKMGAERDYGRTDQSGDAHCPCIHSTKAEMGQHTVRIQSYGNFGNPPPQPPAPPDVNDSCPCVKPTRSFPEARSLFHRSLDDRVGEMRYPAFRQQSRPPSGAATPARQLQPSSAVITRSDRYSGRYSPTHAGSETLYPSSVASAHRQHAGRVANMYRPSVNRTNYAPPPVADDEYLKRIHDGPGLEALRDPNAAASRPDSRPAARSGEGSGKGGKGGRPGGKTVRTKSPTPSPPTASSPQSVSPTPSGASRGRPEVKKMTASSKHPTSDGDTSKPTTEGHITSGATSPEPSSKQPATAVPILPPPPHPPPPSSVPAEAKKPGDAKAGGAKNAPGASKGGKAKDTAKGKKPAGGEKPRSKPKSSSPSKKGGEAKSSPQSAKKGGGKKPISKSPSPKGGERKSKSKSPPPKGAKSKSSSRPSSPDGKGKGKLSGKGGGGGGEKQKATVGVAMFDDNVALLRSLIPYSQPVDRILRDLDTKNGASDIWWKRADVGDLQHKKTMNTTLNDPGSIRQLEKGDQSNSIDGVINENLESFERSWQPGTLKSSASSLPVSKKLEVSAAAKATTRPSRRQGSRSQPEIATREQLEKPALAVNKSSFKSSGRNKRVAANQSPCTDEVTKQIQQLRDAFMTNSRLNDTRSREAVIDDMHAQIVRASQTVKSEKARGITEKLAAGNLSNMIRVLGNMLDSSPTSPSAAGSHHSGVSASTAQSRDQDTHGYSSDASSNANFNTNANTSNINNTSTSSTTGSISHLLPALQLVSRDELTTLTFDDVENIARASLLAVVAEDASFCAIQNLIATSPSMLGGGERALSDEDANASNNVHRQNQSLKPSSSSVIKVKGRSCTHPNHASAAHTLTKQVYCGLCIYVMMTNSVLLIRKVLLDSVAYFNDAIWTRSITHVETMGDANDVKTKSHQLFHNVQFHSLAVCLLTMIVSEMQRLHCKRCPITTGTKQQQQRKAGKWGGKEATSDDDEEESDGECTECKLFSMYDAKYIAAQMAQRPCCPYLIVQVFTKAHELLRDVMSSFDVQRLIIECDTESMVDFVSSLHTALQRDEAVTKQDDIRDSVYALVMKEAAQFVAADLERLDDSRQRMTSTSTTSHDFKPDVDIITQVAYNEFCSELEDFISTSDDD
jgi:hypothetical protein